MSVTVWTNSGFEAVALLVRTRAGLAFPPHRRDDVEREICRAMARVGVADTVRYAAGLSGDVFSFDDLVAALTVGETYFFREPAQFDVLRGQVLPAVRERRGHSSIRVWSAGCASGEEAYSLAILFDEEGLGDSVEILATDVSNAALGKARAASYNAWSVRGQSEEFVDRYFRRSAGRLLLDRRFGRSVSFKPLNLAAPSDAPEAMDLILCRNVLIYFHAQAVSEVAQTLFHALAPGGWLFLASSDPPLAGHAPFELVATEAGLIYRRPDDAGVRSPAVLVRRQAEVVAPPPLEMAVASAPVVLLPLGQSLPASIVAEAASVAAEQPDADPSLATIGAIMNDIAALANIDPGAAERACAAALTRAALSPDLHYLYGMLLLALARNDEAIDALRRVIYLDRSLAAAHFLLGSLLSRRGDRSGARRAFRNAHALSAARPAGEAVPLVEGETAGRLARAAAREIAALDASAEAIA